jgi:hypothetical protein
VTIWDSPGQAEAVWIEAHLDGLDESTRIWFSGWCDVWEEIEAPDVDWEPMKRPLARVGLEPPATDPADDSPRQRLLRATPYVFSRGMQGTVRDLHAVDGGNAGAAAGPRFTLFPAIGFWDLGKSDDEPLDCPRYLVLRTAVSAIDRVALTVRMPDSECVERPSIDRQVEGRPLDLTLPRRYLPLWNCPSGREIAEGIGVHQAATIRAAAERVDCSLESSERNARRLRGSLSDAEAAKADSRRRPFRQTPEPTEMSGAERAANRDALIFAATETDHEAEIVRQLDRRISRLLRRLGAKVEDPDGRIAALVPAAVDGGYSHAHEMVRRLHKDYRETTHVIAETLSEYRQGQRDRFQLTAAMLATIVLVPTLIASIFGVNFATPNDENGAAFVLFLVVILMLGTAGSLALRAARRTAWSWPGWRRLWLAAILAGLALSGLVVGLVALAR